MGTPHATKWSSINIRPAFSQATETLTKADILDDEDNFEELYGEWNPKLCGAAMADDGRYFAALVGGPRWDDPYTIILMRDVIGQTFSRSDVRRELRDIQVLPAKDKDAAPSYVAISLNGDIYVVGPQGSEHSVIPGTRAESEAAPDIEFNSILPFDDRWLVAGSDGFLKLGKGEIWEEAAPPLKSEYPYREPKWSILGANGEGNIFVVATQAADTRHFDLYPGHPLYRKDMSGDEVLTLQRKLSAERNAFPQLTTLFTGRPDAWRKHELPPRIASAISDYPYVASFVSGVNGNDYVIGSDGLVMEGVPPRGLSEISSVPDREKNFFGGAFWQGNLVLIADSEIFQFDGHLAKTFAPKVKIKLGSQRVQPSAVFSRNERLYVFDYGLRYFIFDGQEWVQRDIPDDLSARPFKGGK
ncbi:hypothetical protein [Rhizobium sp.]|uniref:hypothetical protein n=1 Tax=Rhizobium sp. TaxID=391 RepID=UPI003F7EE407